MFRYVRKRKYWIISSSFPSSNDYILLRWQSQRWTACNSIIVGSLSYFSFWVTSLLYLFFCQHLLLDSFIVSVTALAAVPLFLIKPWRGTLINRCFLWLIMLLYINFIMKIFTRDLAVQVRSRSLIIYYRSCIIYSLYLTFTLSSCIKNEKFWDILRFISRPEIFTENKSNFSAHIFWNWND